MTEQTAYKLHLEQAQPVARILPVQAYDLAKYAFAVNKIENRSFYEKAKNPNATAQATSRYSSQNYCSPTAENGLGWENGWSRSAAGPAF